MVTQHVVGGDMATPIRGILSQYAAASAVKEGAAARSAAGPLAISVSAAIRWVQLWRTGGHAEARAWAATIASPTCAESAMRNTESTH